MAERDLPGAHHAVVDRLVGDLRPVRPLRSPALRLAAWLPLELVALAWVVFFHLRPDAPAALARPLFLLEIGSLAVAGSIAAALALHAAVPGDESSARRAGLAAVLALGAVSLALLEPWHGAEPLREFVARGVPCFVLTTALATLPWLLLLAALARGLPLHGARAAAWAGAAAFLLACGLMRLACPRDTPLHLLVWHGGPLAPAVLLSALLGWRWLGLRRVG